jgi:hypothetical protein
MTRSLALAAAAALLACSHAAVQTEFDPKAEYARYRTWTWIAQPPGPEQAPAIQNPAVLALVRAAVERELGARGLARASGAEPDLLVAVHGFARDRIQVNTYGYAMPVGPYGMYGAPAAYGTEVRQYRDGTLILDLVDGRTKQLVWRGTASDTVSSPSQVKDVVQAAVRDMLVHYPPKVAK